jgi:outer membrane protein assembly factor BamB
MMSVAGCHDTTTSEPAGMCTLGTAAPTQLTFHGDPARRGWNAAETVLTPAVVRAGLGLLWESPALDEATVGGTSFAPHLYASPLYAQAQGLGPVIVAATTNAFVYAIAPCGAIRWSRSLGTPEIVPKLDGGLPLGVLSTPVIDAAAGRIYVASVDATHGWQVFALDLASGAVLPGWPLDVDDAALAPVNGNGPALFGDATVMSQRGALALSPDGATLYVPFGSYFDGGVGWIVAVDTRAPRFAAAFSMAPSRTADANGGVWSAGGTTLDADGNLYATTGNGPPMTTPAPGVWANSLVRFAPPLALAASYTPWNYCQLDAADGDVGGSSPMLFDLDPATTSTPHLAAFGGKQGNVYLVDRDHLAAGRDRRPPCSTDPASDGSLLPDGNQPQFGARGPLNVFGPYSEQYIDLDYGKMRSTPALFLDGGAALLFVTGSTKAAVDAKATVPPCLARLRVQATPGGPAALAVDDTERTLVLQNPGSPVVSGSGADAVVWVLDENAPRTASLTDPNTPHPMLYAVDAHTLEVLWRSPTGALHLGGKYSTPLVAGGLVFVGTDRLQAFGPQAVGH